MFNKAFDVLIRPVGEWYVECLWVIWFVSFLQRSNKPLVKFSPIILCMRNFSNTLIFFFLTLYIQLAHQNKITTYKLKQSIKDNLLFEYKYEVKSYI